VTSDPPLGSSIYHAGSVSFTQRARHGLTFNANYTYAHTIDNSTNEFFTSLLNPRRAQDTNRINDDPRTRTWTCVISSHFRSLPGANVKRKPLGQNLPLTGSTSLRSSLRRLDSR